MAKEARLAMYNVLVILFNLYVCFAKQDIWHSSQFDASFPREELVITDVVTDITFKLNKDVIAWKSVSDDGKIYAVGLSKQSVIILNVEMASDHKHFQIAKKMTEFGWNLTDFEVFLHWNADTRKSEIVLILSTCHADTPQLRWYHISGTDLQPFWTWPMSNNVTHIRFLQFHDDKYRLLLIKDVAFDNLGLYEFSLRASGNEFWLSHLLSLSSPANNSAINFYGSDFYLSIPQKVQNEVRVYKFEDNHFKFYYRIRSNGVTYVNAFKIGFKSFLGIGGEEGGIYKFVKDGLESESIDGLPLSDVDFWLPIPIKTYRDEVALLLQRTGVYGQHKSYMVDVVIYDGQKFLKHEEVPCRYFGEMGNGLDCLVDEEGHFGLFGATVLTLKNVLGVLVPHKGNTLLYMIHSTLRNVKSPVELEIEKLLETRNQLQIMIEKHKNQVEFIDSSKNVIPEEWVDVDDGFASVFQHNPNTLFPIDDNLQIDFNDIADRVKKVGELLKSAQRIFEKFPPRIGEAKTIENLKLSGRLEVLGKIEVKQLNVEVINNEKVTDVFKDVVRKHRLGKISGEKTFTKLQVENLTFERINDVDASEIVLNTDDPIIINGNMWFDEVVEINENITFLDSINKLDLINEIVEMSRPCDDLLKFEHINVKQNLNTATANNISIPKSFEEIVGAEDPSINLYETDLFEMAGNIIVKNVNGEHFDTFKKSLCFTDVDTYLTENTFLDGDINVLNSAEVQFLNGLKFPEDYILKSSKYVTVSGKKDFENPVFAEQLILDGEINDIQPDALITLTTNQSMSGRYIFDDFEATEILDVTGDILGPYVDKLIPNPTLLDTNIIQAKVIMDTLTVEGVITVTQNYNNVNLKELLLDVVYQNEAVTNITAVKNFRHGFAVNNGLSSLSGAINNIPIPSFVTKDTEQQLLLKTLNGQITFENLILHGLYGGVNITKLDEETVKLSGNQFVSSELTFINNDDDIIQLSATEMEILDTINELSLDDYFFKFENNLQLPEAELSVLKVKSVVVEGNVFGKLSVFSMEAFDEKRLSSTRSQEITGQYSVANLYAKNVEAKMMNGEDFDKLFDQNYCVSKVTKEILKGHVKVNKLLANGSVAVTRANGKNITNLLSNYLWSNRDNNFNTGIFEANVFMGQLHLKYFNGVEFNALFSNVIYKNQPSTIINGLKVFINGIRVIKMLNSECLNGIHVDNILTKTDQQQIEGPVTIIGNVVVNGDCEIAERFNGALLQYLSQAYQFTDDCVIVNDDLVFNRLPYINNLIIDGCVNDQNLKNFFDNVVYKNQRSKIQTNTTFVRNVQVNNNLIASNTINGIDFSDFVQEIVLTTTDSLVGGRITFTEPVLVEDEILVDSNLDARYLNNIDLDRWKNDAVFVNRGMIRGTLMFDSVTVNGNANLNYINDIEMNSLIPLRTEQIINRNLEFTEITSFQNISVKGLINGYILFTEYDNSVLMSKPSHAIKSVVIFENNVMVHNELEILGLANDKNLSSFVTINTEQNLTAYFEFAKEVTIQSDMQIGGLINDINITRWLQTSLKTFSEEPQTVNDNWNATGKIILAENVKGNGLVRGLDVHKLADAMEEKRLMQISSESGIMKDYVNVCKDVNAITSIAEKQIYLFKYWEKLVSFTFGNIIENVHHIKAGVEDYVLITEVNACASHLLSWSKNSFHEIAIVETGSITQVITVHNENLVFLISRNSAYVRGCKYSGTNVWKFAQGDLTPLYKLEDHKLLQESLIPGTFYAISKDYVVEYRLVTNKETNIKINRKWKIKTDNVVFVPRGLGTGLAVSDGLNIIKLLRKETDNDDYEYDTEAFPRGKVEVKENGFLPGYKDGDMTQLNVGFGNGKKSLAAVAMHEETSVKGKLDFIKIYEDIVTGKLFHKVPTYKPSSLVSVEFKDNGETLLIFLEDEKILQVYEYKGIEGFKQRSSVNLPGSKLITMTLPTDKINIHQYVIGVVDKYKLSFIYAVMSGNQMHLSKPRCI